MTLYSYGMAKEETNGEESVLIPFLPSENSEKQPLGESLEESVKQPRNQAFDGAGQLPREWPQGNLVSLYKSGSKILSSVPCHAMA